MIGIEVNAGQNLTVAFTELLNITSTGKRLGNTVHFVLGKTDPRTESAA